MDLNCGRTGVSQRELDRTQNMGGVNGIREKDLARSSYSGDVKPFALSPCE